MVDVNAVNYGDNYASTPSVKTASSLGYGRRRVTYDTIIATGEVIGDDILIGKLATGAQIHDFKVITEALGASSTLQLFTRTDNTAQVETEVSEAMATDTAAVHVPEALDIDKLPTDLGASDYNGVSTILLKVAGGTVTGTIKVWLEYSVD